jgi:hypothetical protein
VSEKRKWLLDRGSHAGLVTTTDGLKLKE